MAPPSLVISKLAIEASAGDAALKGLLCMKVSLPREADGVAGRWALFNETAPTILSRPEIHSLPIPPSLISRARVRTACSLLGIPTDHHSPSPSPAQHGRLGADVGTPGQVFLLMEGGRRRRESVGAASPGLGARREWIVILEIEQGTVADGPTRRVGLALPKCLDNALRLQVLPPHAGPSGTGAGAGGGDVDIVSEPKILPLPAGSFAHVRSRSSASRLRLEDGWEDGEAMGPEDLSDSESGDESGWLEGRFQSSDMLQLEWSFSQGSVPSLRVHGDLATRRIRFTQEATLDGTPNTPLLLHLPDGWGLVELDIQADTLHAWRCVDDSAEAHQLRSSDDDSLLTHDDSFSTLRPHSPALRPGTYPATLSRAGPSTLRSSASLRHQTLPVPDIRMDDFSFEMGHEPPTKLGLALAERRIPAVKLRTPVKASRFVIECEAEEQAVSVSGALAPLSDLLLVSPSIPPLVPRVMLGELNTACQLSQSADAVFVDADEDAMLEWLDARGRPAAPPARGAVQGLEVTLNRDAWGVRSATMDFAWPLRAHEVVVSGTGLVRVKSALGAAGREVQRAVRQRGDEWEVVLGRSGRGGDGDRVKVVLDVTGGDAVPMINGEGEARVLLAGEWDLDSAQTNLWPTPDPSRRAYTFPLDSSETPYLSLLPGALMNGTAGFQSAPSSISRSRSRARGILSWPTLMALFGAYVLVSLAQRNQRLGNEVAFVKDELRDLREYVAVQARLGEGHLSSGEGLYEYRTAGRGGAGTGAGGKVYPQWAGSREGGDAAGEAGSGHAGARPSAGGRGETDLAGIVDSDGREGGRDHHFPWERRPGATHRDGDAMREWDTRRVDRDASEVGRVVLNKSAWEQWVAHPTVRSIRDSLRWVWGAVVWLLDPAAAR